MKRCEGCGELVGHRVEICTHCGFRFDMTDYGFGKNKWVAIVLAFFFGGFRGHTIYLGTFGDWKKIFVYLVLAWTGIIWLWSLYDAVKYLLTPDEEFRLNFPS